MEGLVRDCGEDNWEKSTAAEHIECSTGRTELASHARYNHDIRNARLPARHVARGALGRAFDRDRMWDTRWPRRLRRHLRHESDYGPLRPMSRSAEPSSSAELFLQVKKEFAKNDFRCAPLDDDSVGPRGSHAVNQSLGGEVRERVT